MAAEGRGRYRLSDVSEIRKIMGNRCYERGKEKGGTGVAVFPQPSRRTAAPHNRGAHTACHCRWWEMKPSVALPLLPPPFCLPTRCPHSCCWRAAFSPFFFSLSFLSHSLQGCLILGTVWAFRSAQSSSFISFHFSPHLHYLWLVKSVFNSYKVLPMERRVSLCVLTPLVIEFWSFPILRAQSWAQSYLGFNKPRDISITLPCLCFSPVFQYHSTVCIFLWSRSPLWRGSCQQTCQLLHAMCETQYFFAPLTYLLCFFPPLMGTNHTTLT